MTTNESLENGLNIDINTPDRKRVSTKTLVKINGVIKTLYQWSQEEVIPYPTLVSRYKVGDRGPFLIRKGRYRINMGVRRYKVGDILHCLVVAAVTILLLNFLAAVALFIIMF